MSLSDLAKYFIHGITFSLVMLIFGLVWIFLFTLLVVVGSLIGIIIGLVLFVFIIGVINNSLTNIIWSIEIKSDWRSCLVHGSVLSALLLIVHAPMIIIGLSLPNLATIILLLIINSFIDGFIAKNVAGWWRKEESLAGKPTPKSFLKKCIHCGKEIPLASEECQHCGAKQ